MAVAQVSKAQEQEAVGKKQLSLTLKETDWRGKEPVVGSKSNLERHQPPQSYTDTTLNQSPYSVLRAAPWCSWGGPSSFLIPG